MIPLVDASALTSARPFRMMRMLAWGIGATALITALTTFAQTARSPNSALGRAQSDPIQTASFVPSASLAARPAVPVLASGPRFRLDEVDPVEPARSEPPRLNPSTGQREDTLAQGDSARSKVRICA